MLDTLHFLLWRFSYDHPGVLWLGAIIGIIGIWELIKRIVLTENANAMYLVWGAIVVIGIASVIIR